MFQKEGVIRKCREVDGWSGRKRGPKPLSLRVLKGGLCPPRPRYRAVGQSSQPSTLGDRFPASNRNARRGHSCCVAGRHFAQHRRPCCLLIRVIRVIRGQTLPPVPPVPSLQSPGGHHSSPISPRRVCDTHYSSLIIRRPSFPLAGVFCSGRLLPSGLPCSVLNGTCEDTLPTSAGAGLAEPGSAPRSLTMQHRPSALSDRELNTDD